MMREGEDVDEGSAEDVDDGVPPPDRRSAHLWRLGVCGLVGFFGMYGVLIAFGALGLPALLLLVVLGAGAAVVDDRRVAFLALCAGATLYFVFVTLLYLEGRPATDSGYDALAPAVVVLGAAMTALLAGSGYLLHRLLLDHSPDRTIDA